MSQKNNQVQVKASSFHGGKPKPAPKCNLGTRPVAASGKSGTPPKSPKK